MSRGPSGPDPAVVAGAIRTQQRASVRRRALTLMELALTLVVILVLAGAAVGAVKGAATWRRTGGVKRVAADLTYARDLALLTGCRTLWSFQAASQSYTLRQESSPATGALGGTALVDPLTGAAWNVALAGLGGLAISGITGTPDSAVGFSPEGTPLRTSGASVSASIQITLSNGAVLTVDRGSGLAGVAW